MSHRRIIKFKAGYWYHEFLENENRAVIHIGGRTQKNETVHVIVENFEPTVYLELPTRIAWDRTKCKVLYEWLKKTMVDKNGVKYGPVDHSLTQKYIIHYKKLVYCISLIFPSEAAAKRLPSKMNYYRGFHVPGIGNFQKEEFKVHEHNIDAVIKLTADRGITLSSWIKVKEMIHIEDEGLSVKDRKFSSADIDAYVNWKDLSCTETEPGNTYVPPKYISFDIECYSKNHNSKMPNPDIPENVVNQIALTIGTLGDKNRKRIILTLGNPDFVENSDEIRRHGYCESELLLDFKDQVLLYDPDIFLGYNTTKFDWGYLITRAKLCEVYDEFSLLSRIYEKQAEIRTGGWSSSAYGEQKFSYLECHGRTNVDLLIEVERNFRLPNYRLDTVSNHFKIGGKDDLSARALFMIWQMTLEILPKIDGRELTLVEYAKIKSRIAQVFPVRQCHGLIRQYRKKLLKSTREKMCATIKEGMSLMGKYCIQDTVLVVDLAEKLNVWTTMEEMSNVTNVPASYLHTRGQQIKVLAQVYRETRKNGMIIPFNKKSGDKEKFQGAMVVEAHPGEYELVPTLDFNSLYPSIIIAFNICYTTILDDKDPTPDSECHILSWSDHIACPHDPQKRKRKAKDVLCKDHRYRFRKVKYIIQGDGTVIRENEGLMPRLERNLLAARKIHKKDMAKAEARVKMNDGEATIEEIARYKEWKYDIIEKGSLNEHDARMAEVDFVVLNAKQLAVKICANSAYGALGVENGFIPLVIGAASVTAMGRMLITMAIAYIRKIYPFVKLVYGDSVSADTPILWKYNGQIVYTSISHIHSIGVGVKENGKKYITPPEGTYVWSDTGFTLMKRIIKHKTTKKMYRVYTRTGVVDVTEDHSLLNKYANKIKPTEIDVGCELLHANLPIPKNISTDIWKMFFEHTSKVKDINEFVIDCEDKLKCANMYLIGTALGYSVTIEPSLLNTYSLSFSKLPCSNTDKVTHIEELSVSNNYVYDLETDNHHFSAGIGRMVVHNTDSCMIHFEGKSLDEHFTLISEASSKTTHHLKCHIIGVPDDYTVGAEHKPIASVKSTDAYFRTLTYEEQCHVLDYETSPINLEFENMYGWFLLLTKKRYMAEKLNKKGEFIGETLKGNVLTRRDNCKYLRDTYKLLKDRHRNEEDCVRVLCDRIQLLFTRYVVGGLPDTDLIIYMGIKTLMNYAKTKKIEGKEDAKAFIDANKDFIDDPIGPLDPRLVYPNIPQVLLALKMTRRGEEIPPNTRLEFLYLRNPQAQHQGEKAEDYTYYKENGKDEGLRPDEMHYIEKQLAKPITELFNVRFPKPIIPYISLEEQLLKHIDKLNDLQRFRIANTKTYVKTRPVCSKYAKDAKEFVGWDVLKKEGCRVTSFKGLSNDLQFTEYKFVKDDAKVACMLDQLKYHSKTNDISQKEYPELLGFCTLWKSMDVIEAKYRQFGLTRRKWRKPTYVGPKIRAGSNVVTVIKCGEIPEGSVCRIIARSDIPLGKKLFSYTYDLIDTKTEVIEKDVARNVFTTYIVQNDNMMKNILLYRECYAEVVDHLNKLFSGDIAISFCSESESIKK
jgi:DNA polymerase elongation subunit (family B)